MFFLFWPLFAALPAGLPPKPRRLLLPFAILTRSVSISWLKRSTPVSETLETGQKNFNHKPLFSFDPFTLVSRLLTRFILYLQFLNI